MSKFMVKAVDFYGCENEIIESVMISGDYLSEDRILKLASAMNPQIAEIMAKEPQIVIYDSTGRIINAEEIKSATYVIIIPLR